MIRLELMYKILPKHKNFHRHYVNYRRSNKTTIVSKLEHIVAKTINLGKIRSKNFSYKKSKTNRLKQTSNTYSVPFQIENIIYVNHWAHMGVDQFF